MPVRLVDRTRRVARAAARDAEPRHEDDGVHRLERELRDVHRRVQMREVPAEAEKKPEVALDVREELRLAG